MRQKNIWIIALFIGLFSACSDSNKKAIPEEVPSPIDHVLEETKQLLLLVKNNSLVLDSTGIEPYVVTYNLELLDNNYRSEISYGSISLKKVFKCTGGIINKVHFDFYYDSLNTELEQDSKVILESIQQEFGDFSATHSSNTMKTHSWAVNDNILDYELFSNGYTITIRKGVVSSEPVVIEKPVEVHLELTNMLINYVKNDSISLQTSSKSVIQTLFNQEFKSKSNALAFSKAYNESILLSGSFIFEEENLSGIYFDYMYSDTLSKEFVTDAKKVKTMIIDLYGDPSEVATVPISTSYKWNNTPVVLEVFGDGFSVYLEQSNL